MMAFVMVVVSALILTPLILFLLGFAGRGWSWVHGALFASMIAPTDALAAAAILKTGKGCFVGWGGVGGCCSCVRCVCVSLSPHRAQLCALNHIIHLHKWPAQAAGRSAWWC